MPQRNFPGCGVCHGAGGRRRVALPPQLLPAVSASPSSCNPPLAGRGGPQGLR